MTKLNPTKVALALGFVVAVWVLLWTIVLAIGGQAFFDWLMNLHFIGGLALKPIVLGTTIISIIYHFVVGYILGWLFALIWNKVQA